MVELRLDEDMHVHSTFSDGKHSIAENAQQAGAVGILRLGCVDHVRRDTKWVPGFVDAVREAQRSTDVELFAGVEAKLLNTQGDLDVPDDLDPRVDLTYVADHQMPVEDGVQRPKEVLDHLAKFPEDANLVIEGLVESYLGAMARYERLVLAHPFSVLPKVGLCESQVTDDQLARLVDAALRSRTSIEIDERWACPGVRVVRTFLAGGVRVLCSTDSHQKRHIGRYRYARQLAADLRDAG